MKMRVINRLSVAALLLISASFWSCEKEFSNGSLLNRPIVGIDPDNRPPGYLNYYSSEAKLRDTVWYKTYEFYLWQDQLPEALFTQNFRTAEQLLSHLKTYAKDDNGQIYDRFSFLDRSKTISDQISQSQNQGGFGFEVRYWTEADLYVKKVDVGSPAYTAGVRRGWRLTGVNGRNDLSIQEMEKDGFQFLFDVLNGSTMDATFRKPDGSSVRLQLQSRAYDFNPISEAKVFVVNGKRIGYVALDVFVEERFLKTPIESIFSQFESTGVKHVIFDLRYNGGGDVSSAAMISNLLVPSASHNQLMFRYKINQFLISQGWDWFVFAPVAFNKTNHLELDGLYFLVSDLTASASELLINNLTPHMNVKIIGNARTFGKPVGYFAWPIMGVDLYAVSFQTLNSLGEGSYFDGLAYDQYALDDVTRELGNPQEEMTFSAISHIVTGVFPNNTMHSQAVVGSPTSVQLPVNDVLTSQSNQRLDKLMRSPAHGIMFDSKSLNVALPNKSANN